MGPSIGSRFYNGVLLDQGNTPLRTQEGENPFLSPGRPQARTSTSQAQGESPPQSRSLMGPSVGSHCYNGVLLDQGKTPLRTQEGENPFLALGRPQARTSTSLAQGEPPSQGRQFTGPSAASPTYNTVLLDHGKYRRSRRFASVTHAGIRDSPKGTP
jgi:hypothetical protein